MIKNIGRHVCLREKEHLCRYRAYFEGNVLSFVGARAHVRAQMTQIACAVGMRNAILRNHHNVDTILFSKRQFDSFFDTPHTVIQMTHAHA